MSRTNDEARLVEDPLIEQLKKMDWKYLKGHTTVPYKTERQSFFDVLLENRIKNALKTINLTPDGKQWLDDQRINQALDQLKRTKGKNLVQTNEEIFQLLLGGAIVDGDPEIHGGKDTKIKFIDFKPKNLKNNDFLAINQFRVDIPGKTWIIPDIVLFVNGIPLVVIECKSPNASDENTSPLDEGIFQLFRYMNRTEAKEGNEELFHYNQFMIATCLDEAKMGSITATDEWFCEWNDPYPFKENELKQELGLERLSSQHILVSGMLRLENFLNIIRHFIIFSYLPSNTIKIVSQYHQFRAVNRAITGLKENQTKRQHGEVDQRGGIIWHTPGTGKSFEMSFLIRKIRTDSQLKKFKIVTLVDDKKLQTQLKSTLELSNDFLEVAKNSKDLQEKLKTDSSVVTLALVQKYLSQPIDDETEDEFESKESFPLLNESENILVLVDEAHRRHTNVYHANLMNALPNCAKIGFTGTPIVSKSAKKRTHEIFGRYIDIYKITEAEADGVTTKIWYEGRFTKTEIKGAPTLDQIFITLNLKYSQKDLEIIKKKYVTRTAVLASTEIIQVKANDMLRHYIINILPSGHKAQVVTVNRLAAVRYVKAFQRALENLLKKLEDFQSDKYSGGQFELLDDETKFMITAKDHEDVLKRLDFTAIISARHNDPDKQFEPDIDNYTDPDKQDERIERFKKPLISDDPQKQDGLAFIIVKSMLLTGFDAPNEQILYLDRTMKNHELLQTISRVNRKKIGKSVGYVVDYAGVDPKEALDAYEEVDVKGSVKSIEQELPILKTTHAEVMKIFEENDLKIKQDETKCVHLLNDKKIRAHFHNKFKKFHEMMDSILPRPEASLYLYDLKQLGKISKRASRLYRDKVLNLISAGYKVRKLIDQHITASGVDPKVSPISITDPNFESMVTKLESKRTRALEMEHATRAHTSKHYNEDPVFFQKISEKLEQILKSIKDEWDLIEALRRLTLEAKEGRKKDQTGLDPKIEAPFLDLIIEGQETQPDPKKIKELAKYTLEMIQIIKDDLRLKDFWITPQLISELESKVVTYLDKHDLVPFEKLDPTAESIVKLSEVLNQKLVSQ